MPTPAIVLTSQQRKALRQQAHALKPIVMIGNNGLHEGVIQELETALAHHELLKMRIAGAADKAEKTALADQAASKTGAAVVQIIGNQAVLYRPAEEPQIKLPK